MPEKIEDRFKWEERFYEILADQRFVPSSPILMNADAENGGGLSSCFVISIEDSVEGIFNAQSECARIYQYNGGAGFDISPLRPAKTPLMTAKGKAGGAVTFMQNFNVTADSMTRYNSRKSATKIDMQVWHPDIHEFIRCKDDGESLTLMNISVGITDAFMKAVEEDADWQLVFPDYEKHRKAYDATWDGDLEKWLDAGYTVKVYETLKARDLYREIAESAWRRGDPGISFVNQLNKNNPNKHIGRVGATNPCFIGKEKLLTKDGEFTFEELVGRDDVPIVKQDGVVSKGKVWCSGEKETVTLLYGSRPLIECTPDHILKAEYG